MKKVRTRRKSVFVGELNVFPAIQGPPGREKSEPFMVMVVCVIVGSLVKFLLKSSR